MSAGVVVAVIAILAVFAVLVLVLLLVVERAERRRAKIARAGTAIEPPRPAAPVVRREVNWFRRVWLMAGVAVLVAAALVAYTFWPAGDLDTADVEAQIESWANDNGVTGSVSVDCPDSMPIKAGAEYHCILTSSVGQDFGVTVHVENNDGEVTWEAS